MHTPNRLPAAILAGAISLVIGEATQAALVNLPSPTAEFPGVTLDPNTSGLAGTVLATLDSPFIDNALPIPFAAGTLRSFVVDRGGGLLDFYYQLVNTTQGRPDITSEFFRMKTLTGFDPALIMSVGQTDSLGGLVAGVGSGFDAAGYTTLGLKPATTADRDDVNPGQVGFDFPVQPPPAFLGDPKNIGAGEASSFLVVRTNATYYGKVTAVIDGAATSFADTIAAIPEPTSALFGIALLGACAMRRRAGRQALAD